MTEGPESSGWQRTQSDSYLELLRSRLETVDLTWVEQVMEIVRAELGGAEPVSIKDIGCQAFQLYKYIRTHGLIYSYHGYELESRYVELGLEYFPELSGHYTLGDFTTVPEVARTDVAITSATIEHVDNWPEFLRRMLDSTDRLAIIRPFMQEVTDRHSVRQIGAEADYIIWRFGFRDMLNAIDKLGWDPELRRDCHTDSLPFYKSFGPERTGLVLTQYVIVCRRR